MHAFRAAVEARDVNAIRAALYLVTELVAMIRPLSGLIALAQAMGARIEAAA